MVYTVNLKAYKVTSFDINTDNLEWPWMAIRGHVNYSEAIISQMMIEIVSMSARL